MTQFFPRSLPLIASCRPPGWRAGVDLADHRHAPLRVGAALAIFIALTAAVRGAEPPDLYRYVPRDAGVCIEIVDLAKTWPEVRDSGWFARLRESELTRQWTESDDFRRFQQVRGEIERALNLSLVDLLSDLFGQRALLSITPGGNPPAVLLVTRARSAKALETALQTWDRLDPALKSSRMAGQQAYIVRTSQKGGAPLSYATLGDLLILSPDESHLKRSLEQGEGLLSDPQFAAGYQTLNDASAVRVFARPRAWDASFAIDSGLESTDRGRRLIARVWKATHAVTLGIEPRDGLTVQMRLHHDPQASGAWQAFAAESQGPAKIFERIPAEALAAYGGRMSWSWIEPAIRDLTPPEKLPEWDQFLRVCQGLFLGHSFESVTKAFGPESCTYVVAGGSSSPEWGPLDAVLAFDLRSPGTGAEPAIYQGLRNALRTGLNVWAAVRNAEAEESRSTIKSREPDELGVTWLQGLSAWQPAFATSVANVVLGSSPEAVEGYLKQDTSRSLASQPAFREWVDRECPRAGQILVVNVVRVREWLQLHGVKLVRHLRSNVSGEQAERRLSRLDQLLAPVSQLLFAAEFHPDQARFVLTIRIAD